MNSVADNAKGGGPGAAGAAAAGLGAEAGRLWMEHSIDPVVFWDRLSKLHKTWNVRRFQSCTRPVPC
jgi:hypothetical protein